MGARPGADNPWSGPRLPKPSIRGPRRDDPEFDPTKGGCFNCGDKKGVMAFGLVMHGKPAGMWRLCEPCYRWGVTGSDLDPDPLHVPDAA